LIGDERTSAGIQIARVGCAVQTIITFIVRRTLARVREAVAVTIQRLIIYDITIIGETSAVAVFAEADAKGVPAPLLVVSAYRPGCDIVAVGGNRRAHEECG
jgi:ABC-type xylose transport system permease subunit